MSTNATHVLFVPDDSHEVYLTHAQVHNLLACDAISVLEDFEPAHPGEVGYTVNDEHADDFFYSRGPFDFLP
jgi:hypothetical protein